MKLGIFFISFLIVSCAHKNVGPYRTTCKDLKGDRVDFYSTKEPFGEFSNFASYPITLDGQIWATSEHYYQAHKYVDPELIKWVQQAESPMEAALRGRTPSYPKRSDWEYHKDEIREKAVREKFSAHKELQALLLCTGHATLSEHTKNDCYWGDCEDRSGKNKLGKLLEKIRSELTGGN